MTWLPGGGMSSTHTARTRRILDRIRAIPEGSVSTYGDIDPAAPRLVGRVLATIHDEVPWHRVVRADGSMPMGERQRDLLRQEGVPLRGDRVNLRLARVPDVWLTCVGCRSLRPALKAAGAALAGALLGSAIMYGFGTADLLIRVPGIHRGLVASVQDQLSQRGLVALMIGPTRGIPYKI